MQRLKLPLLIIGLSFALSGCTFIMESSDKGYTVMWIQKEYDPTYSEPVRKILEIDKNVKKGTMPSYDGNEPFKSGDYSTTYHFKGWTPELKPVTEDVEYEAVFEGIPNRYTVTWKDDELNTLKEETYDYGQMPVFGDDPFKEKDAQYTYTFLGWSKSIDGAIIDSFEVVKHDITYFARFDRLTNNYKVRWVNYDDTLLKEETYPYGNIPSYKGETPYREGNDIVTNYPFIGWDKEIDRVVGDITYKAVFDLLETPTSYFNINDEKDTCVVIGLKYPELKTTLKRISIPSSYHEKPIFKIGHTAFENCTGVETVILPDTMKDIEYGAFYKCSNITSITLNNGLERIGPKAFHGTSKLQELVIPDSVTLIENNILTESGVKKMTVPFIGTSRTEPKKFSYFGIYATQIEELRISEGCTELVGDVMDGRKVDIYLPHSITTLPSICAKNLYYNGTILDWEKINRQSVSSITSFYVKNGDEYTLLTEVNLQGGLTEISDYAFSGINSIASVNIGGTITKINNFAFMECSSMTNAIIGESVTELGDGVFSGSGLVNLELGKGLVKTGLSTFDTDSFRNVYYDGTIEDYCHIEFRTVMFNYATSPSFYLLDNSGDISFRDNNYSLLTELVIPDSVTTIGNGQFYKFTQLTSVTIGSGVTSIGERAFQHCEGITTINVPSNVFTLGRYAFSDCTSLTTATVSGVKVFDFAFSDCSKLTTISAPVLEEYNMASFDDSSIKRIDINNSETLTSDFGIIYSKDMKELKFCPRGYVGQVVVPDGVETIGPKAFENCRSVTEIYLPSTLKTIGLRAFYSCASIDDLVIPNSVTSIGEEALGNDHFKNLTLPFVGSSPEMNKSFTYLFAQKGTVYNITLSNACTSLHVDAFKSSMIEEIVIPDSVTSLPQSIFKPCTSIKKLTLPFVGGSDTENNYLTYLFGADTPNKYGVTPSSLKEVVITSATVIGEKAFYHQSNLTDIYLPDTVNSIENYVLYECSNIVNLRIPFIGDVPDSTTYTNFTYIFGAKTGTSPNNYLPETLDTVTLGNRMTKVPYQAFDGVNRVKHVIFSDTIIAIAEKAFYRCNGLVDINIPKTVTSIGKQAFDNCYNLTTAVIGDGVISLPESAFYSCQNLKTLTIGKNVSSIHYTAFNYCKSLETIYFNAANATYNGGTSPFKSMTSIKTVVFGDYVNYIADGLFRACNQMTTVTFGERLYSIGNYAFYACASLNTINYNSTSTYWSGVSLGENWNYQVPATVVHCLKGNVKEVNL